jgi:pimeloyl-ACP methyl ester carboxylesterase
VATSAFRSQYLALKVKSHTTIEGAGHFLQDDAPEALSRTIITFYQDNPL